MQRMTLKETSHFLPGKLFQLPNDFKEIFPVGASSTFATFTALLYVNQPQYIFITVYNRNSD